MSFCKEEIICISWIFEILLSICLCYDDICYILFERSDSGVENWRGLSIDFLWSLEEHIMLGFIKQFKLDLLILVLLVLLSGVPRFVDLKTVPSNISGDEVTNLVDMYRVVYGKGVGLFGFAGDGTEAGITVYWPVVFLFFYGMKFAFVALRASVAVLSILSLIAFYLLLRMKTNPLVAFVMTSLLGANYVFLNFSRTGWVNMGVICSGLFLLLFLEKARVSYSYWWYILAGICAGLTFYGYHYGKIFVVFVIVCLAFSLLSNVYWEMQPRIHVLIFYLAFLCMIVPFVVPVFKTKGYFLLLRPQTVSAFNLSGVHNNSQLWKIFKHQAEYTFRGMVLLDGKVMSEGLENLRYVPLYSPPVDIVVKWLFIVGLVVTVVVSFRELFWWWIVGISSFLTVFMTTEPPNFARGLFYLVFIYMIVGVFVWRFFGFFKRLGWGRNYIGVLLGFFLFVASFLYYFNVTYYFNWMQEWRVPKAREPAISVEDFPMWQQFQINRIKTDELPLTTYEWEGKI